MFKRFLSIMLLLVFIPTLALGEAFTYSLSFSSAGAQENSVLAGMLDFVEMMHLSGIFQRNDQHSNGFEITSALTLDGTDAPEIDFFIWGIEQLFHVQSPMWNNEDILINIPAMLEYGMKIYNHLDIPIQRFCILYPYVTYDAFFPVWKQIRTVMTPPDPGVQEWTVPSSSLDELGASLSDMQFNERGIRIWLDAMTTFNAAGEELSEIWESIPEWLTNEIAEVTVITTENSETWKTVSHTLYSSEVLPDGSYELHVSLPGFIFGEDASFDYVRTLHDETYDVDLSIALGTDEHLLLTGSFTSRSVPVNLPAKTPFSASADFRGPLLYGLSFIRQNEDGILEPFTVTDAMQVEISGDSDHLSLMNAENEMFTVHIQAESFKPETQVSHTPYEFGGLNFFSLHDSSLHEFMESAKDSLIEYALPLVIYAPVSTVVSLMDVLQDGGILDLLAYGFSSETDEEEYEDGEYEDEYDEYDEADYDEATEDEFDW